MIAPIFSSLAREHSRAGKVAFVKINVDSQQTIARTHSVSAMPTFIIFHRGSAVKTIKGANPAELRSEVAVALRLAEQGGPAGSAAGFTGAGRRLGGEGVGGRGVPVKGATSVGFTFDPIGWIKAVLVFVGLYLWTLFSVSGNDEVYVVVQNVLTARQQLDPYKAAENSPFNPKRPTARPAPSGGSKGPAKGPAKQAPSFRTLSDLKDE